MIFETWCFYSVVSIFSVEEEVGGEIVVEDEEEEGRVVEDETLPLASRIRVRSLFISMAFCMSKLGWILGPEERERCKRENEGDDK